MRFNSGLILLFNKLKMMMLTTPNFLKFIQLHVFLKTVDHLQNKILITSNPKRGVAGILRRGGRSREYLHGTIILAGWTFSTSGSRWLRDRSSISDCRSPDGLVKANAPKSFCQLLRAAEWVI